ncbi:hypothetical protein BDV29DRAFT_179604 [Aspergillus leporis]|jgi:hypothetical protein|uniref:Uncharacterized protein n=1 Tax=Aspergillus leporis TaxID=41062 RepID=A0A5N5WVN2_9EURO|nr:hypothetical protein BDV29DRAFT_179604 [Aspergillus leporis]
MPIGDESLVQEMMLKDFDETHTNSAHQQLDGAHGYLLIASSTPIHNSPQRNSSQSWCPSRAAACILVVLILIFALLRVSKASKHERQRKAVRITEEPSEYLATKDEKRHMI